MSTLTGISKQVRLCLLNNKPILNVKRHFTGIPDEAKRQNDLFITEQNRQKKSIGRIEKIEVLYEGPPENSKLIMNKNISTPYDCAKHLGSSVLNKAVVALLNQETLWHMHKPLPDSCRLELLHYHLPNPASVNKTFWRSCSFILGAIVSSAFKENIELCLHSFPSPNVKSGSYVYDVQLSLDDWTPSPSELKVLSIEMIKFCQQDHMIECLTVDKEVALEIFKTNAHKTQQIPDIAAHYSNRVTLFKVGTHIDISRGPMVPNTNHLGRITVTNVIKLDTDIPGSPIYRFQGVALPKAISLNHFAYSLLENRAKSLNTGRLPGAHGRDTEDTSFIAHAAN